MSEPELDPNTEGRYHFYSIQLFSEAMHYMSKVLVEPKSLSARNVLIHCLQNLISTLNRRPHHIFTSKEMTIAERSLDLLKIADESVNGPDTTEGRAKLYTLVEELKKL